MKRASYKIPKNLCQVCYETGGRFILDCYCILCENCYAGFPQNKPQCNLCGKHTNHQKIDAKQQQSIKKISHFFDNIDNGLEKIKNNYQFQTEIVNRYCQHLEKQLAKYQEAVNQIITYNPSLYSYFNGRVNLKKGQQTQRNQRNYSLKTQTTIKPQKEYNSEIYHSRRTEEQFKKREEPPNMKRIGPQHQIQHRPNLSGNAINRVPNLNMNTAQRSSKRSSKPVKLPSQEYQFFHRY